MITKRENMQRICILENDIEFVFQQISDINDSIKKLNKTEKTTKRKTTK